MRRLILSLVIIGGCLPLSHAQTVESSGTGSVTTVDLSANFNSLATFDSLVNYTEGGLSIATPGSMEYAPDQMGGLDPTEDYYIYGGITNPYNAYTDISVLAGTLMSGVQFNIGNGNGNNSESYIWQTLDAQGVVDGSGTFSVPLYGVVGFSNSDGFAQLDIKTNTGFNAVAIDNLEVQTGSAAVPDSGSTAALAGMGFMILGLCGWRRARRS